MIQTKIAINPQYESFSTFIKSIPDIYDKEGEILYDGRNKVRKFLKNNVFFVVKRYKNPLFFNDLIIRLSALVKQNEPTYLPFA